MEHLTWYDAPTLQRGLQHSTSTVAYSSKRFDLLLKIRTGQGLYAPNNNISKHVLLRYSMTTLKNSGRSGTFLDCLPDSK